MVLFKNAGIKIFKEFRRYYVLGSTGKYVFALLGNDFYLDFAVQDTG